MTAITIGLINNMPDAALEATESQFRALLDAAAGQAVQIRCTTMPEVPRGTAAAAHIAGNYYSLADFLQHPPDALIVTGTEPLTANLRDEPYWPRLAAVVDWARALGRPSVWSCLAAHAAVLHLSGITRHRFDQKCCGLFRHDIRGDDALISSLPRPLVTPHSRWNDLPEAALEEAGYSILSASTQTGANVFVMRQRGAPMVFLQGHPEYEDDTLLKEYRRDVGRYVRAQRPTYPTLPHDYFSAAAIELLGEFRERAEKDRRPKVMSDFPTTTVTAGLRNTWREGAIQLYRNWLKLIGAAQCGTTTETHGML